MFSFEGKDDNKLNWFIRKSRWKMHTAKVHWNTERNWPNGGNAILWLILKSETLLVFFCVLSFATFSLRWHQIGIYFTPLGWKFTYQRFYYFKWSQRKNKRKREVNSNIIQRVTPASFILPEFETRFLWPNERNCAARMYCTWDYFVILHARSPSATMCLFSYSFIFCLTSYTLLAL